MKTTALALANSTNHTPSRRDLLLITLGLALFASAQMTEGQTCNTACESNGNTAFGRGALNFNFGTRNTAVGDTVLFNNMSGSDNTAVGFQTLTQNSTGSQNTSIGSGALADNFADNNTATGFHALEQNNNASRNTATGANALLNNNTNDPNNAANDNTADGFDALQNNTSGADNTATGSGALSQNTIGNDNTATGFEVLLKNTSGTANTASGLHALEFNTTGSDNTASGLIALQSNTTGAENTALGAFALGTNSTGKNNTAEGSGALANATTGSNNVAVGFDAGLNLKSGGNNIIVGANVPGTASDANTIRIGKLGTQQKAFVAGIYNIAEPVASGIKPVYVNSNGQLGTTPPASSARFKEAIKPMDKSSEAILGLKPVTFRYKNDAEAMPQFGLIAEEVAQIDPDLVIRDEQGKIYTVRYDAVSAMLLNEFLKEHQKVATLEAALINERKKFEDRAVQQQKQIDALAAAVQDVTAKVQLRQAAQSRVVANN
jgi:Chaperone of endosialidase